MGVGLSPWTYGEATLHFRIGSGWSGDSQQRSSQSFQDPKAPSGLSEAASGFRNSYLITAGVPVNMAISEPKT